MAENSKMAPRRSLEVLPKNLNFNTWRPSGILPISPEHCCVKIAQPRHIIYNMTKTNRCSFRFQECLTFMGRTSTEHFLKKGKFTAE